MKTLACPKKWFAFAVLLAGSSASPLLGVSGEGGGGGVVGGSASFRGLLKKDEIISGRVAPLESLHDKSKYEI